MGRARTPQDAPDVAGDLFGSKVDSSPVSGSDTASQGHEQQALRRISAAFRSLETFRTLAWMRVERREKREAVAAMKAWEDAVRQTREEYEKG